MPLRAYTQLLYTYLHPQWRTVAVLTFALLSNIALQLVSPQLVRAFLDAAQTDAAQTNAALTDLWVLAGVFMGLALLQQVLSVWTTYLSEKVSWTATNDLRADLALHCLRLELAFHKTRTPGELIERIDGDVNALANFFSQLIIQVLGNGLLLVGVLLLLLREDWRVGLGLSVFALLALLILFKLRTLAVPRFAAVRQVEATFYGALGEYLAGTEDLRANGAAPYVLRQFFQQLRAWLPLQTVAALSGYSMWLASLGTFALGTAIAFGLSAYLWQAGLITLGTVYLIFNYTENLRRPIEQIRVQLQELQKAGASITRIQELLRTEPAIRDEGQAHIPAGALAVDLKQLEFHYERETAVLQGLNLHLPAGRVLGLLGRTGSGKTTLARLLLRLYDFTGGDIHLNGVSLRAVPLAQLRQRVGLVTQDVQLFNATVRDNLTFFDQSIKDEAILTTLEELGLGPWFGALPGGLDTVLAAEGGGLSAGEAQLLAFARLFLRNPSLVILDEASSRLDPATEQLIERAISRLLQGRTGIIIAHRLSTVQRADDILILEAGRILEHGSRAALAQNPQSHFSRLLQTGLEAVLA